MVLRNILAVFLLPALFAFSTALSIPTNPTIIQLPAQNLSSLTLSPWPSAPYRFSVPKSPIYLSFAVKLNAYGPPGPSTIDAERLLKTLANQVLPVPPAPYERIRDFNETAAGVEARFVATGTGYGYGLVRTQAATLFDRLRQLTRLHGAVGFADGEIEVAGRVVERFELEWMFE